jgi:hypothetical protein
VDDFETRRGVAQEAMGARHITRRQDETIRTRGERLQELRERRPETGKAFKCAEFQHFIEQKRRGSARGRPGLVEKGQGGVERFARGRGLVARRQAEWRIARNCAEKPLRRRRGALDIDVLALGFAQTIAKAVEKLSAPRAEIAQHHGNA